jgi:hypothetical protein
LHERGKAGYEGGCVAGHAIHLLYQSDYYTFYSDVILIIFEYIFKNNMDGNKVASFLNNKNEAHLKIDRKLFFKWVWGIICARLKANTYILR